jgi:hypothetical protein
VLPQRNTNNTKEEKRGPRRTRMNQKERTSVRTLQRALPILRLYRRRVLGSIVCLARVRTGNLLEHPSGFVTKCHEANTLTLIDYESNTGR